MSRAVIEPIVCDAAVNLPPAEAFRHFTAQYAHSKRHGADAAGYRSDMGRSMAGHCC